MKKFSFSLDYHAKTKSVKKHWQFCIGSGHAALAHRADYLKQLKIVRDELGMERVRFHGIFNDDMHVCLSPDRFLPVISRRKANLYNFYQIGKLYDSLLDIGVQPFVEIGFMPSALASGKKTVFYYKGNVTQPKNMNDWQSFVSEFVRFLIRRYGAQEVRRWYFEVWNEPDLACFFKGNMDDYYRLYAATAKAIKSVDAHLTVGGPATTKSSHITEFLNFCKNENAPVDFVSTHQYPTDELGHSLNRERLKQLRKIKSYSHTDSMSAILQPVFDNVNAFTPALKGYLTREAKRARKDAGNLPLFYTEWSISSNCVAAVHDTVKAASFLVKTVLDNQGIVDGSSYWTFSDIFEELFFFPEPFCGGFGLMTVDGIKKPAFWAFKMLSELPDCRYELPITDEDVEIAAFRGDNKICMMLYAQSFQDENRKYDVSIHIKNLPFCRSIVLKRINSMHGNPLKLWEEMGKPASLTRSEVADIQNKSEPSVEKFEPQIHNGETVLNLHIENNEVLLITVELEGGSSNTMFV